MNVSDIKAGFLRSFHEYGYKISPSAPLLTSDPSLLFVNASITPFKPAMLAGDEIPNTAQVQRCFRAKLEDGWLLFFEMLGIVGMVSQLNRVTQDLMKFFSTHYTICRNEHLHTVIHPRDSVLQEAWLKATGQRPMHFLVQNSDKFWTRWGYGRNVPLKGRGLTVVWEDTRANPCCADCDVHCLCSRFLPIGNIIVIENSAGAAYVEAGFGAECLASLQHKGDMYKVDEYAEVVRLMLPLGYTETESKRLANLLTGISRLVQEGCQPGNRGALYVLRYLIRRAADIVIRQSGSDSLIDGITLILQEGQVDAQAAKVVANECLFYDASIRAGIPKARRFLRRNSQIPAHELGQMVRDTFGLPTDIVDQLLSKKPNE